MGFFNSFFGFSEPQLRALLALASLSAFSLIYLIISEYAAPLPSPEPLTIYVGGEDQTYTTVFKLDLNHSPADSLEMLPGIGPALAERIVAFRDSAGLFQRPSDITHVQGIGLALYNRIKPYISTTP